jgi:hypothetical protein
VDQANGVDSNLCNDADKNPDPELPEIQETDYSNCIFLGGAWFNSIVGEKHLNLPSIEAQKCALNFLSMRLLL